MFAASKLKLIGAVEAKEVKEEVGTGGRQFSGDFSVDSGTRRRQEVYLLFNDFESSRLVGMRGERAGIIRQFSYPS